MKLKLSVLIFTIFAACIAGKKFDFDIKSEDTESNEYEKFVDSLNEDQFEQAAIIFSKKKAKPSKLKKAIALGSVVTFFAGTTALLSYLSSLDPKNWQYPHVFPPNKVNDIGVSTIKLKSSCVAAKMLDANKILLVSGDGQINICNIKTKKVTPILRKPNPLYCRMAAISNDGKTVVLGHDDSSSIEILNTATDRINQSLSIEKYVYPQNCRMNNSHLSISHDGKLIAITPSLFNNNKISFIFDCESKAFIQMPFQNINSIKFNPKDSGIMAFTSRGKVWIMQRSDSFQPKQIITPPNVYINYLEFNLNENYILASTGRNFFDINLDNGCVTAHGPALNIPEKSTSIEKFEISPDGKRFLVTSERDILLYDYQTFRCLYRFRFNIQYPYETIKTASFSPGGSKIIVIFDYHGISIQPVTILSDLAYEKEMGNMLKYLKSARSKTIDGYLNQTIFEYLNTKLWRGSEDGNVIECFINLPN